MVSKLQLSQARSMPSSIPSQIQNLADASMTTDDPRSPYYLHHFDNPGMILVTNVLTGENYASWSRAMKMALSAKNKLGFVDGSIEKPDSTYANFGSWLRANNMVLSWILNAIHRDLAPSILYAESALDVWSDLNERFSLRNGPRIYQLQRSIATLQQHSQSVAVYYNTLKGHWDELTTHAPPPSCTCSGSKEFSTYLQQTQLMQFHMGLNDTYSNVRSQILLMDPLPSISKACSLVLQDEAHRLVYSQSSIIEGSDLIAKAPDEKTSTAPERISQPRR
ncbi:PREDICTED: uncharacterized protein LOC104592635 [Nelumbo nucifera]|uniref:Uncharacterized protein LOC104592635 n=1 Tax=Nelumbo nucifera TaxID=4432 RepID=A0A1U7ZA53_NELNU|nr:PREDICTED: uncharacterized protein LOC104592635 [Nelumbo nucifera]